MRLNPRFALLLTTFAAIAIAEPTLELRVSGPTEILEGDPESTRVDARGVVRAGLAETKMAGTTDAPITTLLVANGAAFAGTSGAGLHRFDLATGKVTRVLEAEKQVVSALALHDGKILAATGPDGRIVAIGTNGKGEPFADPVAKYVWSMLSDGKRLLIATGEPGGVLELGPAGASKSLFATDETHMRSLARHPERGIIAGGGSKGIVYQIKPNGGAFALYDSGMEEVTSLVVDPRTGDIFASMVSETKAGAILADKTIGPVASDPTDSSSAIKGSEVVRIKKDGGVETLWSSRREGALALVIQDRTLFIATGGGSKARGRVYGIDLGARDRVDLVARVEPRIASAMVSGPGGVLLVGTAPAGQLVRLGPGPRAESVYLTSEQDLTSTARIGRIWFDADVPAGARVDVSIRTGNTKAVDDTWSPWSGVISSREGGAISVPESRYVQLKAVLRTGADGKSPALRSLHASIQRKNQAPKVDEVFVLRDGVYLRPMPGEEEKEKTVTVSTSQLQRLRVAVSDDEPEIRARQGVMPGMVTAAWRTEDPNKDVLLYRLEIRRAEGDVPWRRLADDLEQEFHTFDGRSYPDGRYQLRVTATDRPSNPPADAMSDQSISEVIVLDHTPPKILRLEAKANASGGATITAEAEDATSFLGQAQFAIDGGPWLAMAASDKLTDDKKETFVVDVAIDEAPGALPKLKGTRTVAVRVEDERGNAAVSATTYESP